MRKLTLALPAAAGLAAVAGAADAQTLNVTIDIPRVPTASYHEPYVAIWIENPADQTTVRTLAVWYDTNLPDGEGKEWLDDLRTWWRKGGRNLRLPAAGVSGPTRAPGRQTLSISAARLGNLPAGQYNIVVEAVRELGGRSELVRVPFRWGGASPAATQRGATELTSVTVSVTR